MSFKDLSVEQKQVYAQWAGIFNSVCYDMARALGKAGLIEIDEKPITEAEVTTLRETVEKTLMLDTPEIHAVVKSKIIG